MVLMRAMSRRTGPRAPYSQANRLHAEKRSVEPFFFQLQASSSSKSTSSPEIGSFIINSQLFGYAR